MAGRPLPRVFSLLGVEKDLAVDDALREALPHLGEEAREAALKLICDRGRPATLAALLVSCGSFDPALQKAMYRRFGDFHPGLRTAIESEKFEDRAAAISVVVAVKDYKSAHSLADALRSHCARTRELAADAIRQLAEAHIARRERGISPADAADFDQCAQRLGEVLQTTVKNWESHLHVPVLEAALWMIDSVEEVLAEKLSHVPNRIGHAVQSILNRAGDPRLAAFVVRAISHAELRAAAAKTISQASDATFIAALASEMWLLADTRIEQGFHGVHDAAGFEQWLVNNQPSRPEGTAGAVRMICSSGGPRDGVIARLSAIAEQGSEPTRQAVLWRLVADETPHSTQALSLIASRANDPRSVIAVRECNRRQSREGAPLNKKAADGESTPVRKALDRFIEEHDRLSPEDRSSLAGQFKSLGPDLVKQLERKLENPRSGDRAGTIRAIRTLGLVPTFLPRIYRSARDTDPSVRSTALNVLDGDNSPTAVRLLRDALNDPDPRVQATAIEVLERMGVEKVSLPIRAKFESTNNRVRANAIKALWKVEMQKASQELEKMLKDNSAHHRLSALWVVERIKARPIMERLMAMSRSDPDPRVRSRARRVLEGLGVHKELV
jgi:HEAT repeat protein